MFSKVLKYDIKAVGRLWWILAAVSVWFSVIGALALRFIIVTIDSVDNDSFLISLMMIGAFLLLVGSMIVILSSPVLSQLIVYYRYYRNFFTDEGYLTFTLPVSRKKLLLAKSVNAFVWTVLTVVLVIACFCLFFMLGLPSAYLYDFYAEAFTGILEAFAFAFENMDVWNWIYIVESLLAGLAYMIFGISLVHYSILTGAVVAKKYKLLAGIGIYYLANMIVSFIIQTVIFIGSAIIEGISYDLSNYTVTAVIHVIGSTVMLLGAVALAFIMYLMTQRKLERKLNLD